MRIFSFHKTGLKLAMRVPSQHLGGKAVGAGVQAHLYRESESSLGDMIYKEFFNKHHSPVLNSGFL